MVEEYEIATTHSKILKMLNNIIHVIEQLLEFKNDQVLLFITHMVECNFCKLP
jgi:Asp-tRNA(Asn)/Glu-tRNA(Gln) amidotransferase C subunit